jgi:pimeloyl-ACP methyl ester carboxylesterase
VLVVPETRANPDARMIRLPVAILPSLSNPPATDPLVYMEGGPGGAALPTAQLLLDAGLNRARDVIVMGQRGTRYAEPALMCPEIDHFHTQLAALPYDAAATGQLAVEAVRACRARLAAAGIELSAYNTTESAADFADLRAALNIAVWNVYGVSYGTDLALTYMREHPQGIRSVTIDSVVPPHLASAGLNWTNAGVGLNNIFRACAAERACRRRYPQPAATLARVVRALEAEPLKGSVVPVLLPGDKPAADRPVDVVVDGGALVNWAIGLTEILGPKLPALLDDMARGRTHDVMASVAATADLHQGDRGMIGAAVTAGRGQSCGLCEVRYRQSSRRVGRLGSVSFPQTGGQGGTHVQGRHKILSVERVEAGQNGINVQSHASVRPAGRRGHAQAPRVGMVRIR